jgi:hypothetical protein
MVPVKNKEKATLSEVLVPEALVIVNATRKPMRTYNI